MTSGLLFIDEAGPSDVTDLVGVERQSASHPWTERHFVSAIDPGHRTRVLALRALDAETGAVGIVGFCALRRVADEIHVENLAIAPAGRRRGLGRLLLRVGLESAIRHGATMALLEVREGNAAARSLYESEGFRPIGR